MKLHIGGKVEKEGWTIFNTQRITSSNLIGDICDLSQFENESIEEIYGSHVLEHLRQKDVESALKGMHRVLKKNGYFLISKRRFNNFYLLKKKVAYLKNKK